MLSKQSLWKHPSKLTLFWFFFPDPAYAGIVKLITSHIPIWWKDVEDIKDYQKLSFLIYNKVNEQIFCFLEKGWVWDSLGYLVMEASKRDHLYFSYFCQECYILSWNVARLFHLNVFPLELYSEKNYIFVKFKIKV